MQPTPSSAILRQPFPPLHTNDRPHQLTVPPSRSLNASIWAPHAQTPGGTWLKDGQDILDGATLSAGQPDYSQLPSGARSAFGDKVPPNMAPELSVRGGQPLLGAIGAIGEGRARDSQVARETEHVEQLFRSLDLTSPILDGPLSPVIDLNVSPTTSASFPNTPIESSPPTPRSAEAFFHQLGAQTQTASNPYVAAFSSQTTGIGIGKAFSDQHMWAESNNYDLPQDSSPQTNSFPYQLGRPFDNTLDGRMYSSFPTIVNTDRLHSNFESQRRFAADRNPLNQYPSQFDDRAIDRNVFDFGKAFSDDNSRTASGAFPAQMHGIPRDSQMASSEPINFLSLLHPSSNPPYVLFVARIVKSSDQQASIFLQQKLKVADDKERVKIVEAICTRGTEMMSHRFGNWAVQRCLEAASSAEERRKIASCMKGSVVELATNCYGCHVLQKALDCEEDIRLLIVSELLRGDPAKTLVNKHASHVWSKIMEISWTPPAPPIFAYVNKALQGKWASLACHETGSLVVQHAFENLEDSAKDGIIEELLNRGETVFADVAKNQWGSYCVQHILEHGSFKHRSMALSHIIYSLLDLTTHEQGFKSVSKALKEGGKDTMDRIVARMRESPNGRRAIIVDLALSVTGSQLIASILPNADKEQRAILYDAIRSHIVTLRGCKTGSKVIWLFDRMVGNPMPFSLHRA